MDYEEDDFAQDLKDLAALDGGPLPVVIFNGPICTSNGLYRVTDLEPKEGRRLVKEYGLISAVGHVAAASLLSQLLAAEVPKNRIQYEQLPGQKAIALNLDHRPGEGQILSLQEIKAVGFSLKLLERLE